MVKRNITQLRRTNYEVFIIILTLLSWLNLILVLTLNDADAKDLILIVQLFLTFIFLLDVLLRSRAASSRRDYFFKQYGWLDLIGSFPFLQLARIYRVFKTWKKIESMGGRHIFRSFFTDRAETAVLTLTLAVIFLFEFASIAILNAEANSPQANIETANDAVWWVLVTVATVGYGDLYPVTNQGRFVAIFVIVSGVGLFGILSGFLARNFLGQDKRQEEADITAVNQSVDALLNEIQQLRQEQEQNRAAQEQTQADISARLASLEQLLQSKEKE